MVMACSGLRFCFSSPRVAGFFFLFSLVFLLLRSLVLGSLLSCFLYVSPLYLTFHLPFSLLVSFTLTIWVLTAFSFSFTLFSVMFFFSVLLPFPFSSHVLCVFFFFSFPSPRVWSLLWLLKPDDACIFPDNKDIRDRYCRSKGNGQQW